MTTYITPIMDFGAVCVNDGEYASDIGIASVVPYIDSGRIALAITAEIHIGYLEVDASVLRLLSDRLMFDITRSFNAGTACGENTFFAEAMTAFSSASVIAESEGVFCSAAIIAFSRDTIQIAAIGYARVYSFLDGNISQVICSTTCEPRDKVGTILTSAIGQSYCKKCVQMATVKRRPSQLLLLSFERVSNSFVNQVDDVVRKWGLKYICQQSRMSNLFESCNPNSKIAAVFT